MPRQGGGQSSQVCGLLGLPVDPAGRAQGSRTRVSGTDPFCGQQKSRLLEELPQTSLPQAKTFCSVNGFLLDISFLSQKSDSEADLI